MHSVQKSRMDSGVQKLDPCCAPSGLSIRRLRDPGRRCAAVAAPLCPGLFCLAPSGRNARRVLNTRIGTETSAVFRGAKGDNATAIHSSVLSTVFGDPLAVIFEDEGHSDDEFREIIIGHSVLERLLLVSFTERGHDVVRIISARKATKKERKDHEEGIRP